MLRAFAAALILCAVAAGCGGSHHRAMSVSDSRAILAAWRADNYHFNHFLIVPGTVGCNITEMGPFPDQTPGTCTTSVANAPKGGLRVSFLEHWKTSSEGRRLTGGWTVAVEPDGKVHRITITGSKPPELGG